MLTCSVSTPSRPDVYSVVVRDSAAWAEFVALLRKGLGVTAGEVINAVYRLIGSSKVRVTTVGELVDGDALIVKLCEAGPGQAALPVLDRGMKRRYARAVSDTLAALLLPVSTLFLLSVAAARRG